MVEKLGNQKKKRPENLLCIYSKRVYMPKRYGFITLFRAFFQN